ncbi:hypothetical protein QR77_20400 [Streptomyces sp. 150FB]|uniref:DoxX family protein n=1 Tax=Streptomyces sp. 150FB TaxID=1576605 RepID=UPI000588F44B|nr:DoxX family protein [Streptomyces sp. 150FB]KIF75625.1 hypothetical protein QR77_20400 [Streptomyces sp. 150FB]
MNIVLWIAAALLALLFAGSGYAKAFRPKEKIVESIGGWAEPFPPASLKAIGLVEILGAIGLILPALVNIAPVLVPVSAVGFVLTMVGAVIVHARRTGEGKNTVFNLVLLVVAAFVAWGRFGPYSF